MKRLRHSRTLEDGTAQADRIERQLRMAGREERPAERASAQAEAV